MDSTEQRTHIDIDIAAKQRLSNFRFRFGSMELDSPSSIARDISPNTAPTGTPISKSHGRSPSHHSRSHSRTGSLSTTFTFPLKPSTMNNLPPDVNTSSNQSPPSASDSSGQQTPFGFIPSGTTPRSRPNSHHKRRSSVSTRRESAEIMGVSAPETESDTIMDGRRMALWALEGKGKTTTRRPDFISGYTQVEIPELNETARDFSSSSGDENEPPTWSSSESRGFSSFNHNSFPPPLALNSSTTTKRDTVSTTGFASSSGKRDTYPFFGPGITNSASKRDSYGSGFGIGMMSSVGKRDSFGKFLNACTASDQLGTLLEEEEDVEEEEEEDEGEKGEEEEEECDEDEEAQRADETFRAADETQMEGKNVEEPEDDDDDEILLEMNRQLNEKPLPHVPSHRQPGLSSCFSPAASPLSALVSTPTATSMSTPASIPTSVTTTMTPTPMQPPIFNSASTTDGISATTVPMAPPTTTIPIVDSLSPFVSSSPISSTTPTPAPAPTSTTTATITSSRPRPANLNLNTGLRPLSLTPDSLPLNTRAASISPLTSSNMNDTSMSAPVSGVTGSASSRVPGLRPLSLVAAVSLSSPSGLAPSQPSVTRRMSLISSSNNMSGSSSSNSSVSYRRSSMSLESDTLPPPPPASSNESSSRPGPLYQYATTLRRTSQSHLPTPGATPTSAVSPLHSGLPFGMSMMREEEECGDEDDDDEDETINNSDELCVEKDGDGQPQGSDGDASTPTGPASTTTATTGASPGKSGLLHSPTLDRPLSPIEQAFLYRTHTSLLGRISELEDIIAKNQQQQHIAGSGQHRLRSRGRSGALSPGDSSDISSSSYGRSRHGRFESSISSVSTNTSIDSAAVSSSSTSSSSSSSEPSDELLQLITDLKAERDSLMRDVQMYQERVAELEKTIATLTRRVEAERRESWVAQERMSVLEIERRRAAEEVSRLKDVVRDLDRAKSEEVERVKTELRLEKERISKLEVQVEDVRRELDAEKVKTKQAEDEANMLRNKVEEMSREMDELRTLVVEQQTQILRFQQAQIHAKRAAPKMFNNNNNSFASTSTTSASTGSCSLSFSNSHSHMSSSSTLAVDEIEADDGEGDDDDGAGAGRFKYVPFGMSPPRSHSHASGATLGSVAEAEEEVGGVPRDITADETGDEDDADNNAGDSENELAHYEDTGEFDGDVLEDDDDEEEDEDVVWGEDATTSSFGDFVPRRNALSLNVPTPVPSPAAAPSGSRHGHARVGSMEKGWSFATARVNTVQAQAQDLTRDVPSAEAPKVDRFFDCIEDSEDDESSGAGAGALANLEFPDSKSFWSGMVKRSESSAGEDEDEMDLPPFLLPAGMDADSSATSSGSSLVLDTIAEEEEEEVDEGLSAYLQTPSWKDLITEKLDIVAEEEDEETADEEGDDECLPSPSLRPSFYAQRNSHIQSLLPRPVSLVPPASVLSQMTPNTLKTTLDETVRSPPSTGSKTNRWSIGASLGVNLGLNHSNSTVAITTPVKTRFSLSPSTPVSISNLDNTLLPTPPPTLIPRLASKSGLSISPTSPVSPSPISAGPSPALSSSSSSPVWSEFAERERELGLSTPTPRSPLSRYGPLSPSRIPTPRKSMGSAIATAGSVSDCFASYFLNGSITHPASYISHEGKTATATSGINGKERGRSYHGDDDGGGGDSTLVVLSDEIRDEDNGGDVGSWYSSSRSRSKVKLLGGCGW